MSEGLADYLELGTLDWQDGALCTGRNQLFFLDAWNGSTQIAKRICYQCPVRKPCLEFAMDNNMQYGIWGGLSRVERVKLRRKRNRGSRNSRES